MEQRARRRYYPRRKYNQPQDIPVTSRCCHAQIVVVCKKNLLSRTSAKNTDDEIGGMGTMPKTRRHQQLLMPAYYRRCCCWTIYISNTFYHRHRRDFTLASPSDLFVWAPSLARDQRCANQCPQIAGPKAAPTIYSHIAEVRARVFLEAFSSRCPMI